MARLDWLVARPIAHRGLHDASAGIIENTRSAIEAALAAGYAIEVDLQVTADGDAVVHHDDSLDRLTEGHGPIGALGVTELKRIPFKHTVDRMMTLGDLCELVAGRVTLVLELKSRFDRDRRLPARVETVLRTYRGPAAVMSFDPYPIGVISRLAPDLPCGIVAESQVPPRAERIGRVGYLRNVAAALPRFVAYAVNDLPALAPLLARHILGLPLLTWTVRDDKERQRALRWADQMIFEGFRP